MMIDPPSLISGNAFCTVKSVPRVFKPNCLSKCSSVMFPKSLAFSHPPALAKSTSILPLSRLTVVEKAVEIVGFGWRRLEQPVTLRPSELTAWSRIFLPPAGYENVCALPSRTTQRLASANPLEPPVMTATLPSSLPMMSAFRLFLAPRLT